MKILNTKARFILILVKLLNYLFSRIGSFVFEISHSIGYFLIFFFNFIKSIFSRQIFLKNIAKEIWKIGFNSIPIVSLTAFFAGCVLTLQLYESFKVMGIINQIPFVVFGAMTKDLGPVLAGLMIVARVGSSVASEASYMKSENQIDVLKSMSINHFRFLFLPKLIGIIFGVIILFIISLTFGIIGSYLISVKSLSFVPNEYINLLVNAIKTKDIFQGFFKMEIFGISTVFTSYYFGFKGEEGSLGLSESTVKSVIFGSIFVLFFNFLFVWFYN